MMRLIQLLSPKYFALLLFTLPSAGLLFLGAKFFGWVGVLFCAAISGFLIARFLSHFLVFVPKKQGLILMNTLVSGENGEAVMRSALSGLSFRYPWEQGKEDGYVFFERIRIEFTESMPAADGPQVKVKGSLVILPDPENLVTYFVSRKIAAHKVLDVVLRYISGMVSKKEAKQARDQMTEISAATTKFFEKENNETEEERTGTAETSKLEESNGIIFESATIADICYEDSYQSSLTTKRNMQVLKEAVDAMTEKGMPENEAWENVFLAGGSDKVTKEIKKVAGVDTALKALSVILTRILKGLQNRTPRTSDGGDK